MPESPLPCPVCDGTMRRGRRAWLFVCQGCGVLGSDLQPAIPSEVSESVIDEDERQLGLSRVRDTNNAAIIAALRREMEGPRSLLDVGAGLGFFLRAASGAGFRVTGIEPDANVVQRARRGGFDVRHGYFPDCLDAAERFDVLVFNDVLEHIPDAGAAITAAARHLTPGGLLVLNCPDRHGFFYTAATLLDRIGFTGPFLRMWQYGTPSPHRWYFTKDDLFALGARQGLEAAGSVVLKTLSREGLAERVFYMKGQARLTGWVAYLGASLVQPFLPLLRQDLSVAIMRKP